MSNYRTDEKTPSEIRILAVDTSSPQASYAIIQGEKVLASLSTSTRTLQSQVFFANISMLLALADLEIKEIDVFAAATGPGSFTGLRVGLAAAKGMAHSLGRPSIGVSSIDAMALSAGTAGLVLVMLDAARGEVYGGLRNVGEDGFVDAVARDLVGAPSDIIQGYRECVIDRSLTIVGDGAHRYRVELKDLASGAGTDLKLVSHVSSDRQSWQFKTDLQDSAVAIGRFAARLVGKGIRPAIRAYYIRPSDAEIKRKERYEQQEGG